MGMKALRGILLGLGLLLAPAYLPAQQLYVVVAGIAHYRSISDLKLPVKDAKAIAALFRQHTPHVVLLTGKYATKAKLLSALQNQFSHATESDGVVFAFSGHGYPGGFCPYDMSQNEASGLSYREIQQVFKTTKAKRKVIYADACYAGGLRTNHKDRRHTPLSNDQVLLFVSSRSGETSIETPLMANGFFTSFLLRGLRGGADRNKDRKITARELFDFVSVGVQARSKGKQHPVMWGKFDGNMILMDWNKK